MIRRREKAEQAAVANLYRTVGCYVYDTSQPFRAAITPGLPDLLVFLPSRRLFWFHEVKAPDGVESDAQVRFRLLARSCQVEHVVGGLVAAKSHLVHLGLLADLVKPGRGNESP